MAKDPPGGFDLTRMAQQLAGEGYVVLEGLLDSGQLTEWRGLIDRLAAEERRSPFLPGDGPVHPGDEEIESYLAESYAVSRPELARMMQRVRHTRAENRDTPWPVGPREINKTFMHIPNLFDHDRSQYVRNLPAKTHLADGLVEHPVVLGLAHRLLGRDCVLGDVTATSIGPGTPGGPWHLDNPLTQMPEPLPDFPLGFQVAWMIDPFAAANGATRIGSPKPLDSQQAKLEAGGPGRRESSVRRRRRGGDLAGQHLAPDRPQFHRSPASGHHLLLPAFLDQTFFRLPRQYFSGASPAHVSRRTLPVRLFGQWASERLTRISHQGA